MPMKPQTRNIGFFETITIIGRNGAKEIKAKIDTGADSTSIDMGLAARLQLGPVIGTSKVTGKGLRVVVPIKITLNGVTIKAKANLSDRSKRVHPVLIGKDILRKGRFWTGANP
jgi:hypothetical protein